MMRAWQEAPRKGELAADVPLMLRYHGPWECL